MVTLAPVSATLWAFIALFILLAASALIFLVGFMAGKSNEFVLWKSSRKRTRSVLGGMFSEQVAPFLPNFRKDLKASEARFIGKPIDFIIFRGMDEQDISEVVFVEVKSGHSQLSTNERKLRDAIQAKRVSWYEYHVDGEITHMPEVPVALENAT